MKKNIDQKSIVSSAVKLATQTGLEKITLKEIALELNIKTPSLYNHIKNIDELKILVATKGLEKLKEIIVDSSIGLIGEEAILLISKNYLSFAKENPVLYQAINAYGNIENEHLVKLSSDITTILFKIVACYTKEIEEQTHIVRGLRSIIDGFCHLNMTNGFAIEIPIDQSLEYALKAYIKGITVNKKTS